MNVNDLLLHVVIALFPFTIVVVSVYSPSLLLLLATGVTSAIIYVVRESLK